MKARLVHSRELTPGTRHFEFESPDWPSTFLPGQFVSLTQAGITRAYSIASAPCENSFALCANLVEGGRFSPFLFAMRAGDEVDFKGPLGGFTLKSSPADSIFVATGTGIAPFRSMLQSGPARNVTLVFGVRHPHGLLYHEEFESLQQGTSGFRYLPTLTRPPEHWNGISGRVQQHVLNTLGDRTDVDIYVCGMKEMVDDLRSQLKARGYDRKRIICEKYD